MNDNETQPMVKIRNERKEDYRIVEELTRKAFWNMNEPGCNEHYLAHILRGHKDFIPEPDFVAEIERQFEPMKKEYLPCQEEFYIHSHSVIVDG